MQLGVAYKRDARLFATLSLRVQAMDPVIIKVPCNYQSQAANQKLFKQYAKQGTAVIVDAPTVWFDHTGTVLLALMHDVHQCKEYLARALKCNMEHYERSPEGITRSDQKCGKKPHMKMSAAGQRKPIGGWGWFGPYHREGNGDYANSLNLNMVAAEACIYESQALSDLFPTVFVAMKLAVLKMITTGGWAATMIGTPISGKYMTRDYESKPHLDPQDVVMSSLFFYLWLQPEPANIFARNKRGKVHAVPCVGLPTPGLATPEDESYTQYFNVLELGVRLKLRDNSMVLLNTAELTHWTSAPERHATSRMHMYATALNINAETLKAGDQHILDKLSDLRKIKELQKAKYMADNKIAKHQLLQSEYADAVGSVVNQELVEHFEQQLQLNLNP